MQSKECAEGNRCQVDFLWFDAEAERGLQQSEGRLQALLYHDWEFQLPERELTLPRLAKR